MTWFSTPDLAGNWRTQHQTVVRNMMQLDNQRSFFSHPLLLSILEAHSQFWPIGWMPVAGDTYPRTVLVDKDAAVHIPHVFILDESELDSGDYLL